VAPRTLDVQLSDPAFTEGLAVKGDLHFELRASGPQLVEVFLAAGDNGRYSYLLEAGGKTVDERYRASKGPAGRRPGEGVRTFSLLGSLPALSASAPTRHATSSRQSAGPRGRNSRTGWRRRGWSARASCWRTHSWMICAPGAAKIWSNYTTGWL